MSVSVCAHFYVTFYCEDSPKLAKRHLHKDSGASQHYRLPDAYLPLLLMNYAGCPVVFETREGAVA